MNDLWFAEKCSQDIKGSFFDASERDESRRAIDLASRSSFIDRIRFMCACV